VIVSVKSILLSVWGGIVLIAILLLFVKAQAAPATPNPQKVQEALLKYKRTHTAPSGANLDDPWARTEPASTGTPAAGAETGPVPTVAPPIRKPTFGQPVEPPPQPTVTPEEAATPDVANDPRLESMDAKDEANRLYDKQDFEGAMEKAAAVLKDEPGDIRMLRVLVSSACQMGDADKAKQYWGQLPPHDQQQLQRRCQRFGITFEAQ
jgi:hypothetical protein